MKAQPHDPKDRFTYKLPFDYDPKAICPTFDASLALYSCNDESWVKAFWEIAGYATYGEYPFQKMFWFTGSKGRNGKGTCIRIIENLVGDKYTVSDIDTRDFREKFYKHRLIGKRLATAGDLHNRLANVASLKQLTGGDRQTTDIKFGDAKSFISKAKFIFAMNQLPMLPPDENIAPIAKRIKILPFDYNITKPDQTVEEKIYSEMSGIFNRAIDGLKQLLEQREFTFVKRGSDLLEQYQNKLTSIDAYLVSIIHDINIEGIFLWEIFANYQEYMRMMYGDNWTFDKDVSIRNSYSLGGEIKRYFSDKGITIKTTKEWCAEKYNSYNLYCNIRFKNEYDIIKESTNINIKEAKYHEPTDKMNFPLKEDPDF